MGVGRERKRERERETDRQTERQREQDREEQAKGIFISYIRWTVRRGCFDESKLSPSCPFFQQRAELRGFLHLFLLGPPEIPGLVS
jgi:hypothetical protein